MEVEINQSETQNPSVPRALLTIILAIILLGSVFSAGLFIGAGVSSSGLASAGLPALIGAQQVSDDPVEDVDLDVFWEAWNTIDNRFYYDVATDEERIDGAIQGMLNSLDDRYTTYIPPEAASVLRQDDTGSFDGIGAFVETGPNGGVFIVRVFDGGPADQAGVMAGDIIVEVDGQDVTTISLSEALLLIRGESGTDVDLLIFREGESDLLEITVTRGRLEIPTVESELLDNNIGYVSLFEFNEQGSNRLRSAVRELENNGAEALILDLRNNPGGFLDVSIEVADMFLDEGIVVIQRDVDGNFREFSSDDGDFAEDIPLVVLINGGSASASEIVAGAIKDRDRGTLIGETSFGKGSVQLQFDLSNEGLLRVTYANWYTPNDTSISEVGVEPDIVIEAPLEATTEDPQLDAAIEYLLENELQ